MHDCYASGIRESFFLLMYLVRRRCLSIYYLFDHINCFLNWKNKCSKSLNGGYVFRLNKMFNMTNIFVHFCGHMVQLVLHTCVSCNFVHFYVDYVSVCICQDCEVLEAETKRFEDLEFQHLENESRQDDEKETQTQQLLREIADYQRSTVTRKVTAVSFHFFYAFSNVQNISRFY